MNKKIEIGQIRKWNYNYDIAGNINRKLYFVVLDNRDYEYKIRYLEDGSVFFHSLDFLLINTISVSDEN